MVVGGLRKAYIRSIPATMSNIIENANGKILKSITAFRSDDNLDTQLEASKITP